MEKLVHVSAVDDEYAEITEKWGLGNYNDAPKGFREVDEEYIVTKTPMRAYTPLYSAFKQVKVDGKTLSLHFQLFHDYTGVAYYFDYWAGKIRWFVCGCKHDYTELTRDQCMKEKIPHHGNCWHVIRCKTCGYTESYDSSG